MGTSSELLRGAELPRGGVVAAGAGLSELGLASEEGVGERGFEEVLELDLEEDFHIESDPSPESLGESEMDQSWNEEPIADESIERNPTCFANGHDGADPAGIELDQVINLNDDAAVEALPSNGSSVAEGLAKLDELRPMKVKKLDPSAMRSVSARRKKSSPLKSILAVIFGGMISLPIAGGILSLAGRPLPLNLGFWPFNGNGSEQESSARVPAAPLDQPLKQIGAPLRNPPIASELAAPQDFAKMADNNASEDALSAISGMNAEATNGVVEAITPALENPTISRSAASQTELTQSPSESIEELGPGMSFPDLANELSAKGQSGTSEELETIADSAAPSDAAANAKDAYSTVFQPVDSSLPNNITEPLAKLDDLLSTVLADPAEKVDKKLGISFYRGACLIAGEIKPADITNESAGPLVAMLQRIRGTKVEDYSRSAASLWIDAPESKRKTAGALIVGNTTRDSRGEFSMTLRSGRSVMIESSDTLTEGALIGFGTIVSQGEMRSIKLLVAAPSP